jgi:acetaldehyde dehydrogenase/alcohol dehydrogenase
LCAPACSKRAFIVTDPPLFEMGMVDGMLERLRPMGIAAKVFTDVEPDPTLGMVTQVRLGMLLDYVDCHGQHLPGSV